MVLKQAKSFLNVINKNKRPTYVTPKKKIKLKNASSKEV